MKSVELALRGLITSEDFGVGGGVGGWGRGVSGTWVNRGMQDSLMRGFAAGQGMLRVVLEAGGGRGGR